MNFKDKSYFPESTYIDSGPINDSRKKFDYIIFKIARVFMVILFRIILNNFFYDVCSILEFPSTI